MSTKPVTTAPLRRPHRFGEIDPEGSKSSEGLKAELDIPARL
jgi:hypothetical protein